MGQACTPRTFDVAVIGGGIVGLAVARELTLGTRISVAVVEAENDVARHQSGHNSGVIHSGLYYRPGSLKAATCVRGREAMFAFCEEHGIRHERCGKLVVATRPEEIPALDELERRGRANGLAGIRRLGPAEMAEIEPRVSGVAGLHVPETGIVDFTEVARALARQIAESGSEVRIGTRFIRSRSDGTALVLETTGGDIRCRSLVGCAGLQCDRVARACGVDPGLRIVPFRGDYWEVVPHRRHIVRNLVYPVPDPRFPFLGVHFTRTVQGALEVGPNAVLALKREGYSRWSFDPRDALSVFSYRGFWRLAARYWRTGFAEILRSLSRRAFVAAAARLVPDITPADVVRGGCGVRAQALLPDGTLVDDFRIVEAKRMIHVLCAPSPAATASLEIGRLVAAMAERNLAVHRPGRNSVARSPRGSSNENGSI